MSWQTKGRIEIYGQGGPCDRSRVECSHAFPPMLAGYVPPNEWEDFVLKLDKALEPAQAAKDLSFKLMVFALVMIILMFIWTCVQFSTFSLTSSTSDDRWWIFFCIIGGLAIFVPLFIGLKMKKVTLEVKNVIKRICDEASNKYPQMSFQISFETVLISGGGGRGREPGFKTFNYIGVNMAPSALPQQPVPGQFPGIPLPMMAAGGVYGGMPAMVVPPPASAPDASVASTGEAKSAVERLKELEAIKKMISEEDYQKKKAQILDCL